jgi:uncharacterized tellurite resistance protein B-like protein
MIDNLFRFFQELVDEPPALSSDNGEVVALAAVALMLEVARSDTNKQSVELAAIKTAAQQELSVDASRVEELIAIASERVEVAHDLYQFTQLINEHFDYEQKEKLIYSLWQVACADGRIESIEDHIIRRVAGLVHVAHEDFIRLKRLARSKADLEDL